MPKTQPQAHIIESNDFQDIFSHIHPEDAKHTILFLDIDNTLIFPKQFLGSDIWFEYFVEHLHKNKGMTLQEATKKTLELFYLINKSSSAVSVHPSTAQVLSILQEMGVTIIGLTARLNQCAKITQNQLKSAGLEGFLTTSKKIKSFSIHREKQAEFRNNVIYCGMMSKGDCLDIFMNHEHIQPLDFHLKKKIVFVDDKKRNLTRVQQTIDTTKKYFRSVTQYIGIRFGHADHLVTKARHRKTHRIARFQVETFLKESILVDDLQAHTLAEKQARGEKYTISKPVLHSYPLRSRTQTTITHKSSYVSQKHKPFLRLVKP